MFPFSLGLRRQRLLPLCLVFVSALPCAAQVDPFTAFETVDPDYVMVAAHRCGYISNGAIIHPENSIPAVLYSIGLGVDILEVDIQLTSDGVPVLMHDTTVDRTTNGSGAVSTLTLAQVRALRLKGPGGVTTTELVPTLEELMLAAKGKIMVNLDKTDINDTTKRNNIMAVLQATGTVDHAIFKGGASAAQVTAMRNAFPGETIHYMPVLTNSNESGMINMLTAHSPPATELIFSNDSTTMLSAASVAAAASSDTHIWINSLWASLCGGHHDAVALAGDPDGSWGWLIDKGTTIIQTDNPDQLISYLESRGLRGGTPVNRAPVANAQSFEIGENSPLSITLTGSDLDGDSLTFVVTVGPQHGTLSGLAPSLTYTPGTGYRGSDSFSFKVNDGTVDSDVDALVSMTIGLSSIAFGFDDGTRQGWTNTMTGDGASNPNRFEARIDQGRGGGHSPDYSLLHDGNGTWLDGRDITHNTLVVSSPPFDFDEATSSRWQISAQLLGGPGDLSAAPASLAAIPSTTATNGFMGIALRRVSDGTYLLHDHRDSVGQYTAWEEQGWDAAEIASAIASDAPDETYQIDFIDQFQGGWGWIMLDTVNIVGIKAPEADPPVILLVGNGPLTTPNNQFIAIDHPLTDAPGDPDDLVASSGSLFLYGEVRHGGDYAVLGLYPDATTATTNGAIDFGRNTASSGFAVFNFLDHKGANSATARSGGTPDVPIDGGVFTIIAEIDFDSPTTGTLRGWIHDGTNGSLDLALPNVQTSFSSGFSTAPDQLFVSLGSGSASAWGNLRAIWAGDGANRSDAFALLDPGLTYAGWALRNLDPTAPQQAMDDGDGDGCANLLEYFGGSDPSDPSNKPLYQVAGVIEGGLVVRYQRVPNRPGVTGTLQWSTDLASWRAPGDRDGIRTFEVSEEVISPQGSDPETVEASIQTISEAVPQALFVRLAVQ